MQKPIGGVVLLAIFIVCCVVHLDDVGAINWPKVAQYAHNGR